MVDHNRANAMALGEANAFEGVEVKAGVHYHVVDGAGFEGGDQLPVMTVFAR